MTYVVNSKLLQGDRLNKSYLQINKDHLYTMHTHIHRIIDTYKHPCTYTYMHIIIMYTNQGRIQTFDKRGMARCVIIVDVRVAGICAAIVCKAHGHAKHANTKEVWGHAPRIF